jgi:hypothetical protein
MLGTGALKRLSTRFLDWRKLFLFRTTVASAQHAARLVIVVNRATCFPIGATDAARDLSDADARFLQMFGRANLARIKLTHHATSRFLNWGRVSAPKRASKAASARL